MHRSRFALIALAAATLAGCNEPGEVYPRPQAEIHDLLRTVEVPLYMYGTSTDTQASVEASDPAKVIWKVTSDGGSLMSFSATLIPDGEAKTRVVIDLTGAKVGRFGDMEARLQKAREIRNLYLVSMTEAIDSTLDGRAYDMTATYPALMSATAANMNKMLPPDPKSDSR